ncbi:MAG: helix-turn-helix domain-containing protein [Egibacteraceae bacterium]
MNLRLLPALRSPSLMSLILFHGYTRLKPMESGYEPDTVPAVLTVPEACAVLRISKWTLYQLIRSRQLITIKIGSRRVVPVTAIRALLERLSDEETA